ncbi:hypothetical protein NW759_017144 [Fusarium solani]|nr:hypothetical protein NW759_017144 [Fusarium solani]
MPDVEANDGPAIDPISKLVVDAGERHLFYIEPRDNNTEMFNLVALHRMNIHYLRKRLLDEAGCILESRKMEEENSKTLTTLMQDYCNAIRDREFMREWAQREWRTNPFMLKSRRDMERQLLDDLKKKFRPKQVLTKSEDAALPALPLGPWDHKSMARAGLERYVSAILGAAILVLPMVLMVLLQKTKVSLGIVAICTVAFAIGSAYYFPSKLPLELLSVTAAYTAVLVVFVGGSTG